MSGLLVSFRARRGVLWLCDVLDHVCAIDSAGTWHAVEARHVLDWVSNRSRRTTWDTVCGRRSPVLSARSRSLDDADEARRTIPWPPRVAALPDGQTRCRECHRATGRPRPAFEIREAA